jgi:acyl dehydratase
MTATEQPAAVDARALTLGTEVTPLVVDLDATRIVAGAIATRDFMPAHHDRDFANRQGAPDIFMNILSDTAYCSRFLTDWAGPDAMVTRLAIQLGVPVFPGHTLTFTGSVTALERADTVVVVEVTFTGASDLGDHVTGTAELRLPLDGTAQ